MLTLDNGLLDAILAPLALLLLVAYHVYLWRLFMRDPQATVIGSNNSLRRLWVFQVMRAKGKKDILAVQTMRNWIMGSSMLATLSVTLAFGIIAFFGSKTIGSAGSSNNLDTNSLDSPVGISKLNYGGSQDYNLYVGKLFALVFIFLLCFFAYSQSIRLLNHCVFVINIIGSEFPDKNLVTDQKTKSESSADPSKIKTTKANNSNEDLSSHHSLCQNEGKESQLQHDQNDRINENKPGNNRVNNLNSSDVVVEMGLIHHSGGSNTNNIMTGEQNLGMNLKTAQPEAGNNGKFCFHDREREAAIVAARDVNSCNIMMQYTENDMHMDIAFVSDILNRAGLFYTIGTRGYYFSLPIIIWLFGPIPCFLTSLIMVVGMYFLDHSVHWQRSHLHSHGRDKHAPSNNVSNMKAPPMISKSMQYYNFATSAVDHDFEMMQI